MKDGMLFKFVGFHTANSQDKVSLTLQVTASSVCLYFDPSAQESTLIMESQLAKPEQELLNPAREIRPGFQQANVAKQLLGQSWLLSRGTERVLTDLQKPT